MLLVKTRPYRNKRKKHSIRVRNKEKLGVRNSENNFPHNRSETSVHTLQAAIKDKATVNDKMMTLAVLVKNIHTRISLQRQVKDKTQHSTVDADNE